MMISFFYHTVKMDLILLLGEQFCNIANLDASTLQYLSRIFSDSILSRDAIFDNLSLACELLFQEPDIVSSSSAW